MSSSRLEKAGELDVDTAASRVGVRFPCVFSATLYRLYLHDCKFIQGNVSEKTIFSLFRRSPEYKYAALSWERK